MEEKPTNEVLLFFIERLSASFALNDEQKAEIIAHKEELSSAQIGEILRTIGEFEQKIEKDSRNYSEKTEREIEIGHAIDNLFF